MLVNFEDITFNISNSDKKIAESILKLLLKTNKNKRITSKDIVFSLSKKFKIPEVKVRVLINSIRQSGKYGIVGTSKGYYISNDIEDIMKAIKSQTMRISQQNRALEGMKEYLYSLIK